MGPRRARRLFVTGLTGQLGRAVVSAAHGAGWTVTGTIHRTQTSDAVRAFSLDVRDAAAVDAAVVAARPDAVIHTAYLQDGPQAVAVNVNGSEHVARAAQAVGARLVHVSTDVVFRGDRDRALAETDPPDPITDYGVTKAAAETCVAEHAPGAVLVRTSLLYGGAVRARHERMAIDAARGAIDAAFYTDEIRCPTVVGDLAGALVELAGHPDVAGPLHVAGGDAVSRLELARLVAAGAGGDATRLRGVPAPPDRPRDLTLDCSRAAELLTTRMRGVREVLGDD